MYVNNIVMCLGNKYLMSVRENNIPLQGMK